MMRRNLERVGVDSGVGGRETGRRELKRRRASDFVFTWSELHLTVPPLRIP
jgi:hypothetical protein